MDLGYSLFHSESVMNKNVVSWLSEKCSILMRENEVDDNTVTSFNTENELSSYYLKNKGTNLKIDGSTYQYENIYKRVIKRIKDYENKQSSLNEVLRENLINSLDSCSTGKFGKLISTLAGFYDDMNYNFVPDEYFSFIIYYIYQEYTNSKMDYEEASQLVTHYCYMNGKEPEDWLYEFIRHRDRYIENSDDDDSDDSDEEESYGNRNNYNSDDDEEDDSDDE